MEQDNGLKLKDIIKLLLGNKWLYLIMVGFFAICSVIGFSIYSSHESEYVSFYDYDVAGFSTTIDESGFAQAKYIDGEKFDPRSIVTKEKIKEYFDGSDELKDLDAESLYDNGVIKSFGYKVKYVKNDHKKDDKDAAYIEDKRGYEIVLSSKKLSKLQAKALASAIANEVINVSKTKIDKIQYRSFLNYFDNTNNYPEKISSLNGGIAYLKELSSSLISSYGDILLEEGKYGGEDDKYFLDAKTISDWQKELGITFDSYYVDSLLSELEVNGYISNESIMYVASLSTNIANLEKEIAANETILTDLKAQRDALVASIGSNATIESVEIGEYNAEIISLTKKIGEQKETVSVYKLQLQNLDTSSFTQEQLEEYTTKLSAFNGKLQQIRNDLEFYTNQYEAISKQTMKNDSSVYFDSPDIVEIQGNIKIGIIAVSSLAIGFFAPMIINLAVAAFGVAEGKPVFKKGKNSATF